MSKINHDYLKGVAPAVKPLFAKALEQANSCFYDDTFVFTDFFNPVEAEDFLKLFGKLPEISASYFGGIQDAERVVIGMARKGLFIKHEEFPITPIKIAYHTKATPKNLTHRDFLGSILGLGIKRDKVGDIIVNANGAFIFVHSTISDYVFNNLSKIANVGVQIEQVVLDDVYAVFTDYKEKRLTIASLRADALAAAAFSLSRDLVQSLAKSDKLLVNWKAAKVSATVTEGDVLTLRGYGRLKVKEVTGLTKKDRVSLIVQIY